MTIICTPSLTADPCAPGAFLPAVNVVFSRNPTTSVICPHGYVMRACALSVIAPDLSYMSMAIPESGNIWNVIDFHVYS